MESYIISVKLTLLRVQLHGLPSPDHEKYMCADVCHHPSMKSWSLLCYLYTMQNVTEIYPLGLSELDLEALRGYAQAIETHQSNGLHKEQAIVHCQMFRVYFKHNIDQAMKEASNAILADPNYEEVSHRQHNCHKLPAFKKVPGFTYGS